MKNLLFLLLILVSCVSCEKDINTYEGDSGIYFADEGIFSDTLRVAWGLKNSDIKMQSIQLKVCLYGNTANYDRKFNIEVYSDTDTLSAIEGVDFKAFATEYVMSANQAETSIGIDLLRTEDLIKHPKRFVVKLIENPELRFIYTREATILIDSVNFKTRPIDYQRVWSQKKTALICDVMNIDREDFVKTKLTEGYLKFVGKYMHRWLQDNPQEDENGKPMEMGAASQG